MRLPTYLAGSLCLLAPVYADWEEITPNFPTTLAGLYAPDERMITDGTNLYVLGTSGVYVSADNGTTFTAIDAVTGATGGVDLSGSSLRGLEYEGGYIWTFDDPASGRNNGLSSIYRLTIGQTSWTPAGNGFPALQSGDTAEDISYDSSTGTYYATASINTATSAGSVWVSSDGLNWVERPNGISGLGLPSSILARDGVAYVHFPNSGLFKSTDQGLNWTPVAGFGSFPIGNLEELNGTVYLSRDGGGGDAEIKFTSDDGATFGSSAAPYGSRHLNVSGGLITAAGGGLARFGLTNGNPGMWYSATDGLSWDPIDNTGLQIAAVDQTIETVVRNSTHIFAISFEGGGRLWRRPVSELDFRAVTQIVTQPLGGPVLAGAPLTLSIQAVGDGALTYQWKKDNVDIPGANAADYTIANPQISDNGSYTVVVTGNRGSATSDPAVLDVRDTLAGLDDPGFSTGSSSANWGKAYILPNGNILQVDFFSARIFDTAGNLLVSRNLGFSDIRNALVDENGDILLQRDLSLVRIDGNTLADDPSWPAWTATPQAGGRVIRAIAELPGSGYIVVSDRDLDLGVTPIDHAVLVDYNGAVDGSFIFFDATDQFANYSKVTVSDDGDIYVGATTNNFYRVSNAGALLTTFSVISGDYLIKAFGADQVVAVEGGRELPKRYNQDGTQDTGFNATALEFTGDVFDFDQETNGKITFVGEFSAFGSNSVPGYARLLSDGTFDSDFNATLGFQVDFFGILFADDDTGGVTYDPRGFYYVTPVASQTAQFQQNGELGIARMFADPVASPPSGTTFADFADANFPVGLRGLNDDGNGNGLTNFEEYIHVITDGDRGKLPSGSLQTAADLGIATGSPTDTYLTLSVRIRKDAENITIVAKAATDLANIDTGAGNVTQVGLPVDQGDVLVYTYRTNFKVADESQGFIRVDIAEAP